MDGKSEKELETLLLGTSFSNVAHKNALRNRLFSENMELDVEELAMVVGGQNIEHPLYKDWQVYPQEF